MKELIGLISNVLFLLWIASSWVNHVITCFGDGEWFFLIAGAIFFPVAVAHGTWLWF